MMRKLIPLFVFLCSCAGNENTFKKPLKTGVFVFVDKTSSVNFGDESVAQKYDEALQAVIDEHINYVGDELVMYYVHENTTKARCLQLKARSSMEDTYGLNETDLTAAKTSFELSLKKEHRNFFKRARTKMLQANGENSNRETALLASIPLLAEKSMDYDQLEVFYFSDMIESSKRTRDFHKNGPADASTAESWAKEDLKRFTDLDLGAVNVHVLLPFDATSSSQVNNPNVGVYWQRIFENLGAVYEEM